MFVLFTATLFGKAKKRYFSNCVPSYKEIDSFGIFRQLFSENGFNLF